MIGNINGDNIMIKKVVNAYYVHKSNVLELVKKVVPKELEGNFYKLLNDFKEPYDIIKYDSGNITFISSPDFLIADEPIVGYCYRFKADCWNLPPKVRKDFKHVYHAKWMFVADDFDGFDVNRAKERTKLINSISGIDKKRIGNLDYWKEFVKQYNL